MSGIVERLKDEAVRIAVEKSPNGLSSREITGSVIWQAADHLEKLEAWMRDFMDATEPAARPAFRDPTYGDRVEQLGDEIGYGALMSSASASWRERLIRSGYASGGEFVVGPCMGTLIEVRKRAAALLAELDRETKTDA